MARISVLKNKKTPAYPRSDAPQSALKVYDLEEALSKTWETDAHLTIYYVDEVESHPRIQKSSARSYPGLIKVGAFFADIDNPAHHTFTKETLDETIRTLPDLDGLGIYFTSRGYRLLQKLEQAICVSVVDVEKHILRWLQSLEKRGFCPDLSCRDWSRLFRLPNVYRDGRRFASPLIDLSHLKPLKIDVLDVLEEEEEPVELKPIYDINLAWESRLPDKYRSHVEIIAKELIKILDPWHSLFLSIAGALHSREVPAELLPEFCKSIAIACHDTRVQDRYLCGQTTAIKRKAGHATRGLSYLYKNFSALAEAIDVAFGIKKSQEQWKDSVSKDQDWAFEDIKEKMRTAPNGVTIIKCPPGTGKTRGALEVAVERELDNFNTGITVDKNKLAQQITNDIKGIGLDAYRVFGALSLRDEMGNFVCIHHDIAQGIANGGQSVTHELCTGRGQEYCIMYEGCKARIGFEGVETSGVIVSNHNKIKQVDAHIGRHGLLIVDEPKNWTNTHKITKKDLELLKKRMDNFEFRYIQHIRPYLNTIMTWEDKSLTFKDLTASIDLSPLEGLEDKHKTGVPPIKSEYIQLLRKNKDIAEEIGGVSRNIYILYRAKTESSKVELTDAGIDITLYDEDMKAALTRDGAVVVTDANANLHRDFIKAITGEEPDYWEYNIPDNTIERSIIKVKGANRSNWIQRLGKNEYNLLYDNGLTDAFRWIVEWHKPGFSLGIITFVPIEKSIVKKDPGVLQDLLDLEPRMGHYGNIRGMNDFMDLQELVTIGDPWRNRGDVRSEVEFNKLNVSPELKEYEYAQAELEQAHGRLRPTRRKVKGRSLHIGSVQPSGWGWDKAPTINKPRHNMSILNPKIIKEVMEKNNVSQRELSELIGMDQSQLSKILAGKGSLSYEAATKLRKMNVK